jgi:hypothetical protein
MRNSAHRRLERRFMTLRRYVHLRERAWRLLNSKTWNARIAPAQIPC